MPAEETSAKKLAFQLTLYSIQEIHLLHTIYKETINFRLNEECPGTFPCHFTNYKKNLVVEISTVT
jgi:hypothetical protein